MAPVGPPRGSTDPHELNALLLERRDFGESDVLVTLLTDRLGQITAVARHGRKSRRRFAGSLQPMHTLSVRVTRRPARELYALEEASIARPRPRLATDLARMQAAGRALRWVRSAGAPELCEPDLFATCERLLEEMEHGDQLPETALAEHGIELLRHFGWGLELEQCVGCGKRCEPARPARLSPERGGLICRRCGSGSVYLTGPTRARLVNAAHGNHPSLFAEDGFVALEVIASVFTAHGRDRARQ